MTFKKIYLHDREYRNERKVRLTREGADLQLFDAVRYYFRKANKVNIGLFLALLMYLGTRIFLIKKWVKN